MKKNRIQLLILLISPSLTYASGKESWKCEYHKSQISETKWQAADRKALCEIEAPAKEGLFYKKITSYNPNRAMWVVPAGKNRMFEQQHLEFYISLKYPLFADFSYFDSLNQKWLTEPQHRINFVYNGLYDFYVGGDGQYSSGPVISREQNPGFTYELDLFSHGERDSLFQRIELGVFHRSNGQTIDNRTDDNMNGVPDSLEGNLGSSGEITDFTLSSVSRGSNYLSARYTIGSHESIIRPLNAKDWWRASAEFRYFGGGSEDNIWWDPALDGKTKFRDYDGLRLTCEKSFTTPFLNDDERPDFILGASLRTGVADLDSLGNITYTLDAKWRLPNSNTWLTAHYFDGYSENLSTYHLKKNYFGIGITMF